MKGSTCYTLCASWHATSHVGLEHATNSCIGACVMSYTHWTGTWRPSSVTRLKSSQWSYTVMLTPHEAHMTAHQHLVLLWPWLVRNHMSQCPRCARNMASCHTHRQKPKSFRLTPRCTKKAFRFSHVGKRFLVCLDRSGRVHTTKQGAQPHL